MQHTPRAKLWSKKDPPRVRVRVRVVTMLYSTHSNLRIYVASVLIYLFKKKYGYIFQKMRHKSPDV